MANIATVAWEDRIYQAIRDRIEDLIEREIQDSMKRVRTKLAKEVAGISIVIMKHVKFETHGTELVIRVDMPDKEG